MSITKALCLDAIPSLTDCGIDSLGGAVGMLVYYVHNLRPRTTCPTQSEVP